MKTVRKKVSTDVKLRRGYLALRQAEKHRNRPLDPAHVGRGDYPHALAESGARNGRHLVGHGPARFAKAIGSVGFDNDADQRCLGRVGGQRHQRHGFIGRKAIVLHDYARTRLAGIAAAPGKRPKFAALQSSNSGTESTNA